ncbi:ABC transporter ATP-binding protein [Enterococcus timonensis]|uniref:ABC transporter ATP-binding protein n=1 Tax=Enterococcus timonensis TaxID=1852364 RepID=UPI0008D96960|nr:ABC transporter ATP-binding protein [Enterococcus timonensis]
MLEVENLSLNYGAIEAVKGVSFHVKQGEIVTLIGANGAGKSSILKSLSGLLPVANGKITYEGSDLSKMSSVQIVKNGLIQVPEGRHVFPGLTVKENLALGGFLQKNSAQELTEIFARFPILKERINQDAATLSGGEQQMLAMGRALMSKPRLLLLDEPSMGLAPLFITEIFRIIEAIRKQGTTILLVEQNAKRALEIADRAYVLETGRVVLEGAASDLLSSEIVKKAYLGG